LLSERILQTKKLTLALLMMVATSQWGCQFLAEAATGALATGADYEIHPKQQVVERLDNSGQMAGPRSSDN
jgi:hypothetical protein